MVIQKNPRRGRHQVPVSVINVNQPDTDFWDSVGLPSRGAELYKALHAGIPFAVYANLAILAEMEKDELARAAAIPKSTLQRRASKGRFTLAEGDRIFRFAEMLKAAIELFEGDRTKARDWMCKPAQGLGGNKPIEMLTTTAETRGVLDLIGRLEHGVVA